MDGARRAGWAFEATADAVFDVLSKAGVETTLNARLQDGRTIEEAYQGCKVIPQVRQLLALGKCKAPLRSLTPEQLWLEYLALWRQWACENCALIDELHRLSEGRTVTDQFTSTPINRARALLIILSEGSPHGQFNPSV